MGPVVYMGLMVHYQSELMEQPKAAIVSKLWTALCVNLTVIEPYGPPSHQSSVEYDPTGTMPYSWRFIPRD